MENSQKSPKVYILYKENEGLEVLGVYSSFEKARAAGNSFLSTYSHQGPFEWVKNNPVCWRHNKDLGNLLIFAITVNNMWWLR